LLYADEFAHIHANFLEPFYRSIYPTLSSSKISRMIISSTPNGMNLFYDIYQGAIQKKNAFNPIRVDWWQVPGRDEEWKKREIANLGNEELFNQEYGNQFLASSRLLLSSEILQYIKRISKNYKWQEIGSFIDYPDLSKALLWHPDYDPTSSSVKRDQIVFSIDVGDGVGRDYSVITMFKLEPQSAAMVRKTRDWRDETSFFRLKQIGTFRSNTHSVDEVAKVLEILVFEVFNFENVSIVLEINFKGSIIADKLSRHRNYYPEIFLHTKHSINDDNLKQGVKIQKDNKEAYSRELRVLIQNKRIVLTDLRAFEELSSFGMNAAGRYESQIGNDDIAMTCINLVTYFNSTDFYEMVEQMYDTTGYNSRNAIIKKMNNHTNDDEDFMDMYRMIGRV
jgi:hypothetical protein